MENQREGFLPNCVLREIYLLLQTLKNPEEECTKVKDFSKSKSSAVESMKEITFKEENGKHILAHKGQNLSMYIRGLPFENAKRVVIWNYSFFIFIKLYFIVNIN